MLKIRKEQLAALAEARKRSFVKDLTSRITRHWPQKAREMSDKDLRRMVTDGVDRAAGYGIRGGRDVARYANLMMALGPEFDRDSRYPWAEAFLTDEAIAPRHKLSRMSELAARDLEQAEEAGGAGT